MLLITGALPITTAFTLLHRISWNPARRIPHGLTYGEGSNWRRKVRSKRGRERGKRGRKRGKRGRKMGKWRRRGKRGMSSKRRNGNGVILWMYDVILFREVRGRVSRVSCI